MIRPLIALFATPALADRYVSLNADALGVETAGKLSLNKNHILPLKTLWTKVSDYVKTENAKLEKEAGKKEAGKDTDKGTDKDTNKDTDKDTDTKKKELPACGTRVVDHLISVAKTLEGAHLGISKRLNETLTTYNETVEGQIYVVEITSRVEQALQLFFTEDATGPIPLASSISPADDNYDANVINGTWPTAPLTPFSDFNRKWYTVGVTEMAKLFITYGLNIYAELNITKVDYVFGTEADVGQIIDAFVDKFIPPEAGTTESRRSRRRLTTTVTEPTTPDVKNAAKALFYTIQRYTGVVQRTCDLTTDLFGDAAFTAVPAIPTPPAGGASGPLHPHNVTKFVLQYLFFKTRPANQTTDAAYLVEFDRVNAALGKNAAEYGWICENYATDFKLKEVKCGAPACPRVITMIALLIAFFYV